MEMPADGVLPHDKGRNLRYLLSMTWTQQSLERILRAELGWRNVELALAQSMARLRTTQYLLDASEPAPGTDRPAPAYPED